MNPLIDAARILEAHGLYCQLTAQHVRLLYDRERAWYELLKAGYSLQDVRRVIRYLQREIREQRRNVGALKLSNLLQLDRFDEDLNIARIRLEPPAKLAPTASTPQLSDAERERQRQHVVRRLEELRREVGI